MSSSEASYLRSLRQLSRKARDLIEGLASSGKVKITGVEKDIDLRALEQLVDFDESSQVEILNTFTDALDQRTLKKPSAYLCSLITTRRRNSSTTQDKIRIPPAALGRVAALLEEHLADDTQPINIDSIDTQCKVALAQMPESMAAECLLEFKNRPNGTYLRNPSAYLMSTIRRVTSAFQGDGPGGPSARPSRSTDSHESTTGGRSVSHASPQRAGSGNSSPSHAGFSDSSFGADVARALDNITNSQGAGRPLGLAGPMFKGPKGPGVGPSPLSASHSSSQLQQYQGAGVPKHMAAGPSNSSSPASVANAYGLDPNSAAAAAAAAAAVAAAASGPQSLTAAAAAHQRELEDACRRVQQLAIENEILRNMLPGMQPPYGGHGAHGPHQGGHQGHGGRATDGVGSHGRVSPAPPQHGDHLRSPTHPSSRASSTAPGRGGPGHYSAIGSRPSASAPSLTQTHGLTGTEAYPPGQASAGMYGHPFQHQQLHYQQMWPQQGHAGHRGSQDLPLPLIPEGAGYHHLGGASDFAASAQWLSQAAAAAHQHQQQQAQQQAQQQQQQHAGIYSLFSTAARDLGAGGVSQGPFSTAAAAAAYPRHSMESGLETRGQGPASVGEAQARPSPSPGFNQGAASVAATWAPAVQGVSVSARGAAASQAFSLDASTTSLLENLTLQNLSAEGLFSSGSRA